MPSSTAFGQLTQQGPQGQVLKGQAVAGSSLVQGKSQCIITRGLQCIAIVLVVSTAG